ncbi:MAG: chorismate-binding protein, partial [Ferruginibacter sp.]
MNQQGKTFAITDFSAFRLKMLSWVNRFSIFCLLDNSQYHFSDPAFECLLGAGSKKNIECAAGNAFDQLKDFYDANTDWLMGHLAYGLKAETEQVASTHIDKIGFADMHFFIPQIIISLKEKEVKIIADDAGAVYDAIVQTKIDGHKRQTVKNIQRRFLKEEYLHAIKKIQQHILRGDCYEINFCQEFFAVDETIDPTAVYVQLTALSPNPFSSF